MSFDDDVLSAIEEAFGADSASLMEGLEVDSGEENLSHQNANEESLDDLVAQLDEGFASAPSKDVPQELAPRRTRSLEEKHILVLLGEACYGLPMKNILEIQQLPAVTYLPHLPEWVPGVCNLRGSIVSIVDLKQLFGLEPASLCATNRLVVVRTENQDLTTAFVVDEVVRITEVEPNRIRKPVGPLEGPLAPFLKGTYETPDAVICILDIEATLNSPTLRLA